MAIRIEERYDLWGRREVLSGRWRERSGLRRDRGQHGCDPRITDPDQTCECLILQLPRLFGRALWASGGSGGRMNYSPRPATTPQRGGPNRCMKIDGSIRFVIRAVRVVTPARGGGGAKSPRLGPQPLGLASSEAKLVRPPQPTMRTHPRRSSGRRGSMRAGFAIALTSSAVDRRSHHGCPRMWTPPRPAGLVDPKPRRPAPTRARTTPQAQSANKDLI